jgi:hypothetical protein
MYVNHLYPNLGRFDLTFLDWAWTYWRYRCCGGSCYLCHRLTLTMGAEDSSKMLVLTTRCHIPGAWNSSCSLRSVALYWSATVMSRAVWKWNAGRIVFLQLLMGPFREMNFDDIKGYPAVVWLSCMGLIMSRDKLASWQITNFAQFRRTVSLLMDWITLTR